MTENSDNDDQIMVFCFDEDLNSKQEVSISAVQFTKYTGLPNNIVDKISSFLGHKLPEPSPSPRTLGIQSLSNATKLCQS
tara:strand:- start:387 stop:626 length:240 start_codon:yes stop_codon:yes gene_type:complete